MAAETTRAIRRGLPRVRGGEPWPPPAEVPEVARDSGAPTALSEMGGPAGAGAVAVAGAAFTGRVRRGLPRVAGGAPWPEVDPARIPAAAEVAAVADARETPAEVSVAAAAAAAAPAPSTAGATNGPVPARIRRGLPRVAGGAPWPEVDEAALAVEAPAAPAVAPEIVPEPVPEPAPEPVPVPSPIAASVAPAVTAVAASVAPAAPTAPAEPRRYRGLTLTQWVWRWIGGAAAIVAFAGLIMLAARGLLTFSWASDFVSRYPGSYRLPASAPLGFPLWLEWQHFLNAFFMLLIIRTGIQVRRETRPTASWSPRWNSKRRISLTVWLHQALDLLWFANGLVFVVVLFVTGQWMRVIPTSWAVFPNALSAALKYASMNWPTEDGWANYNSLQQLSYFAVIFLLAPLAAITGVRMSGLWQKKWERASRLYPIRLARAVHFPTMIAFCVFILIHVVLVLATGALRNLNHMYGHSDVVNWVGFWLFVGALVVMAAGWVASRPLVVAPIASLFGKVGR